MERIQQKYDNPIAIEEMEDVIFIGEFDNGEIRHLIPVEKQSIPELIKALQKYVK